jgi:hypothetical protein
MNQIIDEVLEKMYDIIEKGWCQGRFRNQKNEYCLYGAIGASVQSSVFGYERTYWECIERLREVIGCSLVDWNDDPRRTKEDVLLAIKRARYG